MNWQNYQLEKAVLKTAENAVLWRTGKGQMEISKGSLAIAIKLGDEKRGYIFHGNGRLILDTIVETREGAIGKPVEKEISAPFIMLGAVEENFTAANQEDLEKMGYEDQQAALTNAAELLSRFSRGGKLHEHHCCGASDGQIFAFPSANGKFDLLVANDHSIVYKTEGLVFVTNRERSVLKSSGETVCVANGRMVVVRRHGDFRPQNLQKNAPERTGI